MRPDFCGSVAADFAVAVAADFWMVQYNHTESDSTETVPKYLQIC